MKHSLGEYLAGHDWRNEMIIRSIAVAEAEANAKMASGGMVIVEPRIFLSIIIKAESPLVIMSREKILFSEIYKYLTPYKGLVFFTDSKQALPLPKNIELLEAERIWSPNTW